LTGFNVFFGQKKNCLRKAGAQDVNSRKENQNINE
jgi:hypothetical protein